MLNHNLHFWFLITLFFLGGGGATNFSQIYSIGSSIMSIVYNFDGCGLATKSMLIV